MEIYYNYKWLGNIGREVIILKSGLSKELFSEFVSNYQTCHNQHLPQINQPFVYVNTDGSVKLVTNVVDSYGGDDDIFALSVAEDGFVEFLAFQD